MSSVAALEERTKNLRSQVERLERDIERLESKIESVENGLIVITERDNTRDDGKKNAWAIIATVCAVVMLIESVLSKLPWAKILGG